METGMCRVAERSVSTTSHLLSKFVLSNRAVDAAAKPAAIDDELGKKQHGFSAS
jgi:hypothetical protein